MKSESAQVDATAFNAVQYLLEKQQSEKYVDAPHRNILHSHAMQVLDQFADMFVHVDKIDIPLGTTQATREATVARFPRLLQDIFRSNPDIMRIRKVNLKNTSDLWTVVHDNSIRKMLHAVSSLRLEAAAWLQLNSMPFVTDQHGQGRFGLFVLRDPTVLRRSDVSAKLRELDITDGEFAYLMDISYKYLKYGEGTTQPYLTHPLRHFFAQSAYIDGATTPKTIRAPGLVQYGPALAAVFRSRGPAAYIDYLAKVREFNSSRDYDQRINDFRDYSEARIQRESERIIKEIRAELPLPEAIRPSLIGWLSRKLWPKAARLAYSFEVHDPVVAKQIEEAIELSPVNEAFSHLADVNLRSFVIDPVYVSGRLGSWIRRFALTPLVRVRTEFQSN